MVRGWRCEDLLHFLATSEMREDGGTFDRCRSLQVEAGRPGRRGSIFIGAIAGPEVNQRNFIRGTLRMRRAVY